jgi:hypothetical protein
MDLIEGGAPKDDEVEILRMLLLGGDDESEDFLAGMDVGVILFLLNECNVKGEDPALLDPLPIFTSAKKSVEKIAAWASVTVEYLDLPPGPGNEGRVNCKFKKMRAQLKLV